jgi:hypothetical protein
MERPLRRIVSRLLAQTLQVYHSFLNVLRRGTVEKHLRYRREIDYSYFYGADSAALPLTEEEVSTGAVLCSWEELRELA